MRVFAVLLLLTGCLFAAGELSGRRAPGFSLTDSHARQFDPQDYRGMFVVVEFFQSTCPHCGTFSGVLEQAAAKYAGKVAFLSIAVYPDAPVSVAQYITDHKVTIPVLFDCGQVAASYYKVGPANPTIHFPHVFVLDPQGMIRNDFEYGTATREIFEGRALFTELDRMLAPARTPAGKSKN